MFDPTNDGIWTTGVVTSIPLQPGRLRTGSQVDRVTRFMGRQFGYRYQVLEADGDRSVELAVAKPFPMHIRYELEDAGADTRTRIHAWGDSGGFFKVAAPLMQRMVHRSIANDLKQLKSHLESAPHG